MSRATTFSGDVGYRGIVQLNNITILATSGSFTLGHNPIFSSGVWGAGYENAAENVAYADNYIEITGSFGFELTRGQVFEALKSFAFTNRGNPNGTNILIYPNGEHGFQNKGWCTSLSLSASTDNVVTGDCNFTSYAEDENSVTTGNSNNSPLGLSDGQLPFNFNDLYPYWASGVYKEDKNTNQFELVQDVVDWSASYSSDMQVLKCCGNEDLGQRGGYHDQAGAPLAPDYIMIGSMTADMNFTIFRLQGDFEPESFHQQAGYRIDMRPSSNLSGAANSITIPVAVANNADSSIQTGSTYVQASFAYTAIGDGSRPPMGLS